MLKAHRNIKMSTIFLKDYAKNQHWRKVLLKYHHLEGTLLSFQEQMSLITELCSQTVKS